MTSPLLIIGDSAFAEVAYECFSLDSPYEVVGFTVERAFLKSDSLFGLPIVPFEDVEENYAAGDHHFFAALVYTHMNRLRTRLYHEAKLKGFAPATYISSRASVWPNATIGEHCFIFEDNTIQPFVTIGDNVVLWSGNHVGHHSMIANNCFVSSHVVISGFVNVGENCFLGVNATLGNNLTIGPDCFIGAGSLITGDVPSNSIVRASRASVSDGALERFGTT